MCTRRRLGDIVAFRCAVSCEQRDRDGTLLSIEPEEIAILRTDKLLKDILYLTNATEHKIFISGKNNFRKEVYADYKANRKDKPRPEFLGICRDYLINEFNAVSADGCEADDLLSIEQTEASIICSIDKDLLQIPGKHFNFVKNEWYDITELQGLRNFYEQLAKGDKADNIPGIAGIGEKKAQRYLEGCETEQEMFDVVRNLYDNDELMLTYGKCLWLWRTHGGTWNPTELLNATSSN